MQNELLNRVGAFSGSLFSESPPSSLLNSLNYRFPSFLKSSGFVRSGVLQ